MAWDTGKDAFLKNQIKTTQFFVLIRAQQKKKKEGIGGAQELHRGLGMYWRLRSTTKAVPLIINY